jgi:hypothetical protein
MRVSERVTIRKDGNEKSYVVSRKNKYITVDIKTKF